LEQLAEIQRQKQLRKQSKGQRFSEIHTMGDKNKPNPN
jgi:hypothetical protein